MSNAYKNIIYSYYFMLEINLYKISDNASNTECIFNQLSEHGGNTSWVI